MNDLVRLGDVVSINPQSMGKDYPYGDINYIDISSVGELYAKNLSISNAPSRAKRIIEHGDIILATVRPNRRSFAFIEPKNAMVLMDLLFLEQKIK